MSKSQSLLLTSQWYLEAQRIMHYFNALSEAYGISYEQFLVLEHIIDLGYNTPGQIATVFKTSAPAASRKINTLQDKQLIQKVRAAGNDQRTVLLEVTEKGNAVFRGVKMALKKDDITITQSDVESLTRIEEQG
ncbi:MarR family winged helix-turn-helix transcriptional regulator [Latilactobacillus sp. 5-91]|uniref:MarR family winged helix-turn-helix transcriptional regulator n=1 Tax=Latilactobacillus sp. 5-91 TaxID=3410924 RepID=UPI003C72078E